MYFTYIYIFYIVFYSAPSTEAPPRAFWLVVCRLQCRKTLRHIVRASLPSLQDIYSTRLTRKALCIAGDPTHPPHTASSICCHQGGACGVSKRGPADWRTASSIRLSGSSTVSRLCPPLSLLPHAPLNSDPLNYICSIRLFHWFALYLPLYLFLHVLICIFVIVVFYICMHVYIYTVLGVTHYK